MMDDIMIILGNFGFPAAISLYLLVRIEGKLEGLTKSIISLSEAIQNEL